MRKPLSLKFQLVVLAILFAGAGAAWVERDRVQAALFTFQDAAPGEADGSKRRSRREGGERPVPVIVARVEDRKNTATLAAIGTARAVRSVMLFSRADGEVMSLSAQADQRVRKGDEILLVDPDKAELSVRLAEKAVEDARLKLQRVELLNNRRVNSVASVEDARIALQRATIELEQAKENLEDTKIIAPFSGVLGIPKIEVGDRITTSSQIVTLDDRSALLVEFQVPEELIARIEQGHRVTATTPGHGDRKFAGMLQFIDSRIDPVSRTVLVRAQFPNEHDDLRPGMSFAVTIELDGKIHPAIPELALQWQRGESYVWTVSDDGLAKRVVVRKIRRLNGSILVEGPLNSGDLVVVEGVQRLRPDRPVKYDRSAFAPPPVSSRPGSSSSGAGTSSQPTKQRG